MNKKIILAIAFVSILTSCVTSFKSDITKLQKAQFKELSISPSYEANNFRIDLIRQTKSEQLNDSTTETIDTPYHPMGFDLGNGLFFDLNNNLCLRIDYLLNFSAEDDFELLKIRRPQRNKSKVLYQFSHGSLIVFFPPARMPHYRYHLLQSADKISFYHKKHLNYQITDKGTSIVYGRKKRKWDAIYPVNQDSFYINKDRKNNRVFISDNEISLANRFIISLDNNKQTIQIKQKRVFRKPKLLITIEKDNNSIYIYDKHYQGRKIILDNKSLTIFPNKKPSLKFELINKTQDFICN